MAIRLSLYDIEAFAPLAEIGVHYGVKFALYGSTASRAAIWAVAKPEAVPTLLDLTPNTSEIELVHNGPREFNVYLQQAIHEIVPYAQWSGWSLMANPELFGDLEAVFINRELPLRQVMFTDIPREIPELFERDVRERRVPFTLGGIFQESHFSDGRRDAEVLGLLMSLDAAEDLEEITGGVVRPQLSELYFFADLAGVQGYTWREPLQGANQLWSLLSSWAGRSSPSIIKQGLERTGLVNWLPDLDRSIFSSSDAAVTSAWLGGAQYRLRKQAHMRMRQDSVEALRALLTQGNGTWGELDAVYRPFALSGWMDVSVGVAPSAGPGPEEFATFSWETLPDDPGAADLTAFLFARDGDHRVHVAYGAAVAGRAPRPNSRTWLRIDIGTAMAGLGVQPVKQIMLAVVARDGSADE